jgi:hypothetical protein
MKKLTVSSVNPYEEQAKKFSQTKQAQRLQKKYQPRPFEERYKVFYYLSLIFSFACNLFSVLTAATFLYFLILGAVGELPYPSLIAGGITAAFLFGLEFIIRQLFSTSVGLSLLLGWNGERAGSLLLVFLLSALSVFFSFKGGYRLPEALSTPPAYEEPTLEPLEALEGRYGVLIAEKEEKLQDYKTNDRYRTRSGSIAYNVKQKLIPALEQEKSRLQAELLQRLEEARGRNELATAKAESTWEGELFSYGEENEQQGASLGAMAIALQLFLYCFLFFCEYYDYRTAKQYATWEEGPKRRALTDEEKWEEAPEEEELQKPSPIRSKHLNGNSRQPTQNGAPTASLTASRPIGYKQYPGTAKDKLEQAPTAPEVRTVTIVKQDRKTIAHTNLKTGEVKHYTLSQVNNFVKVYEKRLQEATTPQREETLAYWLSRKEELLQKLEKGAAKNSLEIKI